MECYLDACGPLFAECGAVQEQKEHFTTFAWGSEGADSSSTQSPPSPAGMALLNSSPVLSAGCVFLSQYLLPPVSPGFLVMNVPAVPWYPSIQNVPSVPCNSSYLQFPHVSSLLSCLYLLCLLYVLVISVSPVFCGPCITHISPVSPVPCVSCISCTPYVFLCSKENLV